MISVYRSSETMGEKRKLRAARGSGITATTGGIEPEATAFLKGLAQKLPLKLHHDLTLTSWGS